jgi:hypothetical protein
MSPILRELANAPLGETRPDFLGREHFVFPCAPVVPLRAGRDLEWTHVRRHVDAGEIEGQRGDAAVAPGLRRRGEVAMPGLVHRALEGGVEADLHDFVFGAEHVPAHRRDPRVRAEVSEAAEGLRMDFHVPAERATANSAAWALDRLPERRHHVLAHALGPVAGERALQRHDSVAVKDLAVGGDVDLRRFRCGMAHRVPRLLTRPALLRNSCRDKVPRGRMVAATGRTSPRASAFQRPGGRFPPNYVWIMTGESKELIRRCGFWVYNLAPPYH